MLWKIAVGLGVPFPEAARGRQRLGPENPALERHSSLAQRRWSDGEPLAFAGGAPSGIEIYDLRLSPRGSHASEPHGSGTTETLILLTGALRLTVGDQAYDVAAGDSIFFSADVSHMYESRSSHPVRSIEVIAYQRRTVYRVGRLHWPVHEHRDARQNVNSHALVHGILNRSSGVIRICNHSSMLRV